jgi:DNA-binding response OmpR family regulator
MIDRQIFVTHDAKKTIVVIDDDSDFRELLEKVLSRDGYTVYTAANGNFGIDLYKSEQVDLVITDIFMPDKEGLETILDLRKLSAELKIIAISGGSPRVSEDCLRMAQTFGADRILRKPCSIHDISETVRELLLAS